MKYVSTEKIEVDNAVGEKDKFLLFFHSLHVRILVKFTACCSL